MLDKLAPELVVHIAFATGLLSPGDVLALATCCRRLRTVLTQPGFVHECWLSLGGLAWTVEHSLWTAARLAARHTASPRDLEYALRTAVSVTPSDAPRVRRRASAKHGFAFAFGLGPEPSPGLRRCSGAELTVPMPSPAMVSPMPASLLSPAADAASPRTPVPPVSPTPATPRYLLGPDSPSSSAAPSLSVSVTASACPTPGPSPGTLSTLPSSGTRDQWFRLIRAILRHPLLDPRWLATNMVLTIAAKHGHADVVALLLADDRIDPARHHSAALGSAAEHGHLPVVELLLADGRADPSARDNFAIRWACEAGASGVVEALLRDPRTDPNVDDLAPLSIAAERGHAPIVRMLLEHRPPVSVRADSDFALLSAAAAGHVDVIRLLLADARVDPSVRNDAALRRAMHNGHVAVVRELVADERVDAALAVEQARSCGFHDMLAELVSHPLAASSSSPRVDANVDVYAAAAAAAMLKPVVPAAAASSLGA
ncbi:ankyrin domain-containing protein [Thecamonas trahens ATCC 50062]|uniref:Ankyrin domain-containing protein n=1 Tax=Thecamonas trahens ATCC 50062 TaxID=461836 RepID=A0A0L0D477_THETB|nr:ankyrin domain-containing protein [Thecamonas trahens ATCC 50062]KNC47162.1 ankyrin domain-containing protein [Thecamonas trahens ATCC 50062]|eukprot:XP_013759936.1 ankyrin domain-containing protein [Thecamonas trahens ATCC 50062]